MGAAGPSNLTAANALSDLVDKSGTQRLCRMLWYAILFVVGLASAEWGSQQIAGINKDITGAPATPGQPADTGLRRIKNYAPPHRGRLSSRSSRRLAGRWSAGLAILPPQGADDRMRITR